MSDWPRLTLEGRGPASSMGAVVVMISREDAGYGVSFCSLMYSLSPLMLSFWGRRSTATIKHSFSLVNRDSELSSEFKTPEIKTVELTSAGMYWSTAVATVAQQIQIRTSTDRTRVVVRIHPGSQGFLWGQSCTLHVLLPDRAGSEAFFFLHFNDQPWKAAEQVVVVIVAAVGVHVPVSLLDEITLVIFENWAFQSGD